MIRAPSLCLAFALAFILTSTPQAHAQAAEPLHGAGATLAAPLLEAWADAWKKASGTPLRYDPIGSGLGIELASRRQVDFGMTDAPLTADRLAAAGLRQFPLVIGAVVPVVNLAGVAPGRLALDAATLSAIYRGRIVNWRDPAIAALNRGLALPDARITVVHRADASGSTWLWSRWLSDSDAAWRDALGSGTVLAWPVGDAGLGNEGVASLVQRTRASIGYVAFSYARTHHLSDVALPSHDGAWVRAGHASFEAAVAAAPWREVDAVARGLTGAPGTRAWPLIGASFMLVPRDGARAADVDSFVEWAWTSGGAIADALGYVALPRDAAKRVGPGP